MRCTLLKLPRYKPHLTDEADYFSVGHVVPELQYSKALQETTKDAEVISFLFCGMKRLCRRSCDVVSLRFSLTGIRPWHGAYLDSLAQSAKMEVNGPIPSRISPLIRL